MRRSGTRGRAAATLVLFVIVAIAIAAMVLRGRADHGEDTAPPQSAAARLALLAPGLLPDDPRAAALLARRAQALESSPRSLFALLDVALDHVGVERVISADGRRVLAVTRTLDTVVSTGRDGTLRVWDARGGTLLAERHTRAPIVRLGASPFADEPQVASSDAHGAVTAWGLADPTEPAPTRMVGRASGGTAPVALGFTAHGAQLLAVAADGRIDRWDVVTGARLPGLDLRRTSTFGGSLGSHGHAIVAAALDVETYTSRTTLVAATRAGDVVRVDLPSLSARRLLRHEQLPGTITSLAVRDEEPSVAIGTTMGVVVWDGDRRLPIVHRGPAVTGVALDLDSTLTAATAGGLASVAIQDGFVNLPAPEGRDATRLSSGPFGAVAAHADGAVSVLDTTDSGIALESGETTHVASFAPSGDLLTAQGYDANHVERLVEVRPGFPGRDRWGAEVAHRVVRSFAPDPKWWSPDQDNLYVNAAVAGARYVVAGGQDPTGTAVVLVWDSRSGRPLQRLALTTSGLATSMPSIVSNVAILPKRHLIAAYSALQETLILWSSDDWHQVATVDVGPAGQFAVSPDERSIAVTQLSDDQSGAEAGLRRSRLEIVDVDAGRVARTIPADHTNRVAYAPDGTRLATLDDTGLLRIRSADARRELRRPIDLDGQPADLAWRADSKLVAVALSDDGTALVDPDSGAVSPPLPPQDRDQAVGVDWSRDGRLLATTYLSYDMNGDPTAPAPSLWTVGGDELARRMCEIAGRSASASEWRRWVQQPIPAGPACPTPRRSDANAAGRVRAPVVAYQRGGFAYVADVDGRSARVGPATSATFPMMSFAWSAQGALGWVARGRAYRLARGAARAESWACPCVRATFDGETLLALDHEGSEMLRFTAGKPAGRIAVRGVGRYEAELLAALPHGEALAVGYPIVRDRSTPTSIYFVASDGSARLLGDAGGIFTGPGAPSPDGRSVAFVAGWSSGVCYSSSTVGLIDLARDRIRPPHMPDFDEPSVVRSVGWSADGALHALVAPIGCDDEGNLPRRAPDGELGTWNDGTIRPGGERAYDVQTGGDATALLVDAAAPGASAPTATLVLERGGERVRVASGVGVMAVRP